MDNNTTTLIKNSIKFSLNKGSNPFISILDSLRSYYDNPVNNILEFKRKTTKNKGDIFEDYCVLYLTAKYPNWKVYKLADIPQDLLNKFNLKRFDIGIDLIAINSFTTTDKTIKIKKDGILVDKLIKGKTFTFNYAIQCKYRKPNQKKEFSGLTWKSLSTFYATCSRTGGENGWNKHIVMTTADYVRRFGRKNAKDLTIAKNTFMNTPRNVYDKIIGDTGHIIENDIPRESPLVIDKFLKTSERLDENPKAKINQRDLRKNFLDKVVSYKL